MKFMRILALILALILCVGAIASCGAQPDETEGTGTVETEEKKNTETETKTESKNESESTGEAESGENERFDYDAITPSDYITLDRADYAHAKITLPTALEVNEDSVSKYIDLLCKEYTTLSDEKITDQAIKEGDVAMIYYEGYRDGVLFDGGSNMGDAEPTALEIGSGQFIPGFEEGLIGIIPAETSRENMVDLTLTFPEDYHNAEMAGVDVVFKVYVEYITEYVPSEYTDEFITNTLQFQTSTSNVKAEFEAYIANYLLSNLESEIRNNVWLAVINAIDVISLPQGEIDYYYQMSMDEYNYYMQYAPYFWGYSFSNLDSFVPFYLYQAYGYELAEDESWQDYTRTAAERSVKQAFAYRYIAEKEGFSVSDAAYQDAINYYLDYYAYYGYTYTAEQVVSEMGEKTLKDFALFEIVTAFIIENCSVTYAD